MNILFGSIFRILLSPDGDEGGGGDGGDGKESKAHVPQSEAFKSFAAKFSHKSKAPVEQGGEPDSEANKQAAEQIKADQTRHASDNEERKKQSEEVKRQADEKRKAGSNIPKILEDKRAAEKERDELKTKLEEFEKTTKPALDKQISDLQSKIDSGDYSTKKEAEFQQRITELESKGKEERDTLVNENKEMRQRLSYFDLSEDPQFKREYVNPVIESFDQAVSVLGNDEKKGELLHRAIMANASALKAKDRAARERAERDRDQILSEIAESMPSFAGNRFVSSMNEYISRTYRHAEALSKHEETNKTLRAKATEVQNKAYADKLESWEKTYKIAGSAYSEDETLSDEEKKIAKEIGIDPESDLKKTSILASKTVVGQTKMEEAIDLIHKGRVYPALKAKLSVTQKQLEDAKKLIEKLRNGSNTNIGESAGGERQEKEKPTREDFHKRFSASRL